MTILDTIVQDKLKEVKILKTSKTLDSLKMEISTRDSPRDFFSSLIKGSPQAIIAECKKKSPSKGLLIEKYNPAQLAKSYQLGGASAISVLTDYSYFGGTLDHLKQVSQETSIPILRKDFILDSYQIYEARAAGADSFLLIAGLLDLETLNSFIEQGRDLGMEPLVESHTAEEFELALRSKGKILGVNTRNLANFSVSLKNAEIAKMTKKKPSEERLLVCESGITSRKDILSMQEIGYSAFLVGESLVRSADPIQAIKELRGFF